MPAMADVAPLLRRLAEERAAGSVSVLTGAGVSVAAGIPDFRSPGGMYDTLRPELITATEAQRAAMAREPTTVVSWDLFRQTQLPYLEVRRPFILGVQRQRWKASLGHYFVEVLHQKGLLGALFTQNIDGLDFQTGVPPERIVPVHGSIGRASCEGCGAEEEFASFCQRVESSIRNIYPDAAGEPPGPEESAAIPCKSCQQNLVKPSTVLYGRGLPQEFFTRKQEVLPSTKLLFIIGTSLTVSPANTVPAEVPRGCMRVLVNRDVVGEMECGMFRGDYGWEDVHAAGACDEALLQIAREAGWLEDLAAHKGKMADASRLLIEKALDGGAAGGGAAA